MKKTVFILLFIILCSQAFSQLSRKVLIEEFTETGCGACFVSDSSFQALTTSYADKIAVINYHCYYMLDTFYQYNKACDSRYSFYQLNGYPSGTANGKTPVNTSSHLSLITGSLIQSFYNQPPQFNFNISCKPIGKSGTHSTEISLKAISLTQNVDTNLHMFIAVTENNINHQERYHTKAVNGVNEFNHILRALLPDNDGRAIGAQKPGTENTLKVIFNNDDREVKFNNVRLVVFIQNMLTREILATEVTTDHPFQSLKKF